MLPKYKKKSYILDKLHRGVVYTLMGSTIFLSGILVFEIYRYFRHVRPLRKEMKLESNKELLAEGEYKNIAI